jgi:hypothetical protein
MANYRSANVIFIDTSAAFTDYKKIVGVKYIGNASGTASIKSNGSSSGDILWEESGASNVFNQVEIRDSRGVYVTVTNSAKVYLYLA